MDIPEVDARYVNLRQIEATDIEILWETEWWDTFLSGLLLIEDKPHYFHICDDDKLFYPESSELIDDHRRYVIIKLTNEQFQQEEYWHNLFLKNQQLANSRASNEFHTAYKNAKVDLWQQKLDNEVIGWFER